MMHLFATFLDKLNKAIVALGEGCPVLKVQ